MGVTGGGDVTTLVVGATGATGRLLVEQLLDRGEPVRVIVRSPERLPEAIRGRDELTVVTASVLDLSDAELAEHVRGCRAVASCLGHTLSFAGIFGQPRRLVREATRRLCEAIEANGADASTKFVLMNTAGNSNRDLEERVSFAQRCVIGLLRLLVPPHVDNEQAADFLRVELGQGGPIEWSVVRPDGLIDEADVSDYTVHASPTRSAIFNAGTTSRVNVAHFMAALITDEDMWRGWRGRMPVIYNADAEKHRTNRGSLND